MHEHEQQEVFRPPSDPNVPIWRYMDLAKFLSMLQEEALYFARVDRMDDEFEGSYSRATVINSWKMMNTSTDQDFERFYREFPKLYPPLRNYSYLNCWHENRYESAAMWAIYQNGGGIAIRSTYRRLSESISDQRPVWIGRVHYIDYDTDHVPIGNIYYPHICKRKSFEHEREIRAFYATNPAVITGPDSYELAPIGPPGFNIAVDLDRLIEEVYVSPKAEKWYVDVIENVLAKYGRTWPVRHSSLDSDPVR